MNKILLTCFLALPCLFGSTTVLRKVAQSPPEPSIHRSAVHVSPHSGDTHRGEETLSDTFLQVDYEAENSSPAMYTTSLSTLDGGPILRSSDIGHRTSAPSSVSRLPSLLNFGLINPDQDMGAGEGISDSQPAPFPVFTSPPYSGREAYSQNTEAQSLVSNVLLLESKKPFPPHNIDGAPTAALSVKDSLTIGDQIPPGIVLDQVLNATEPIRLDDLKGKYVLLQFWAPSCTGSIASLPKVNQLLSEYTDQIELIPITTFSEQSVKDLKESYPSLKKLQGPMAVNGSALRALFPHSVIPHFVLLDPQGQVLAVTGMEDITKENLDQVIKSGSAGNFRLKFDRRITLRTDEKLIAEGEEIAEKNIWFQSALTGYIPNLNGSLIQNFEELTHIRLVNMPLFTLYRLAYSERSLVDFFGKNRTVTTGFEEEELFTDKSGADYIAWAEEGTHVFGYELIAPPSSDPYALMREDLKRYFPNIRASIQTRKQTVLALVQQKGKSYPESTSSERLYQVGATSASLRKYPLQGFVYHLNYYFYQASPYPIVNRTGIDYPIDLDLNAPLSNLEKFTEALQEVGLDLIEREEEIHVLVLEKIQATNPLNP